MGRRALSCIKLKRAGLEKTRGSFERRALSDTLVLKIRVWVCTSSNSRLQWGWTGEAVQITKQKKAKCTGQDW